MAKRPTYTPRFIETATDITKRMVDNIPDTWHKEPGDFIYDAMKTNPAEIIQLEESQDKILRSAFPQYCDDEDLDNHLTLRGLTRTEATNAIRLLSITADSGVKIPQGYTLTSVVLDNDGNPIQYAVRAEIRFTDAATTRDVYAVCHLTGTVGNIPEGSEFVLQPPIPGVRSITDLGISVAGAERESADEYYTRYLEDIENPDTGGNVNDYKRWVLNDFPAETGIVIQKVIVEPRYNGNGTVRVVAIGGDYSVLSPDEITALQNFLDPTGLQGLGYGKAPCGAVVDVSTGEKKYIDITADVDYVPHADHATVLETFKASVVEYIKSRIFEIDPITKQLYPIGYNKIASILGSTEGVDNFHDLTVNGGTADIELAFFDIPELRSVVFNE